MSISNAKWTKKTSTNNICSAEAASAIRKIHTTRIFVLLNWTQMNFRNAIVCAECQRIIDRFKMKKRKNQNDDNPIPETHNHDLKRAAIAIIYEQTDEAILIV